MVKKFSDAYNLEDNPNTPKLLEPDAIQFISNMVNDELEELEEAVDIYDQADALVDAIYYICDTAVRHGINLDPLFAIVHNANMQKVVNGKVIRRESDGKVMKPEGWKDPSEKIQQEVDRQVAEGSWTNKENNKIISDHFKSCKENQQKQLQEVIDKIREIKKLMVS